MTFVSVVSGLFQTRIPTKQNLSNPLLLQKAEKITRLVGEGTLEQTRLFLR